MEGACTLLSFLDSQMEEKSLNWAIDEDAARQLSQRLQMVAGSEHTVALEVLVSSSDGVSSRYKIVSFTSSFEPF